MEKTQYFENDVKMPEKGQFSGKSQVILDTF